MRAKGKTKVKQIGNTAETNGNMPELKPHDASGNRSGKGCLGDEKWRVRHAMPCSETVAISRS